MKNKLSLLLLLLERDQRYYFAFNITINEFEYLYRSCISFFSFDKKELKPEELFAMVHPDDRNFLLARYVELAPGQFKEDIVFRITLPDQKEYTLRLDRKSTRLNSSHVKISYAVFCLKKKNI